MDRSRIKFPFLKKRALNAETLKPLFRTVLARQDTQRGFYTSLVQFRNNVGEVARNPMNTILRVPEVIMQKYNAKIFV